MSTSVGCERERVSTTGICERERVSATGVCERERRGKLRHFRGRGEGSCGVGDVHERERRGVFARGCSREGEGV